MKTGTIFNILALNRSVGKDTSLDLDVSPHSLLRLTQEVCAQALFSLLHILSRHIPQPLLIHTVKTVRSNITVTL